MTADTTGGIFFTHCGVKMVALWHNRGSMNHQSFCLDVLFQYLREVHHESKVGESPTPHTDRSS